MKSDFFLPTAPEGNRHTVGTRKVYKYEEKEGDKVVGTFTNEFEGAVQFGYDSFFKTTTTQNQVQAGFFQDIIGYTFNDVAWKPNPFLLYYWSDRKSVV